MINTKAKSSQDACLPSASPSHFIIIKVQAHQVSSILNGSRRSKWPNFASIRIWFATSWLSIKFVCLFHVFMFLWIQNFHVVFNELCLCVCIYIYIYNKIIIIIKQKKFKKISRFPNLSKKKKERKIFKWKKVFGLGALSP